MDDIIRHLLCARRLKPWATVAKPACAGSTGFNSPQCPALCNQSQRRPAPLTPLSPAPTRGAGERCPLPLHGGRAGGGGPWRPSPSWGKGWGWGTIAPLPLVGEGLGVGEQRAVLSPASGARAEATPALPEKGRVYLYECAVICTRMSSLQKGLTTKDTKRTKVNK